MGYVNIHANKDLLSERLIKLMHDAGDTTRKLGAYLGCTGGAVTRWISKDTTPRTDKVDMMAVRYGVNPFWILGYEGQEKHGVPGDSWEESAATEQAEKYAPSLYDFITTAENDDMSPAIPIGAKVCIKKTPRVTDGEIALITLPGHDEQIIRRIYREREMVLLTASNPNIPPVRLSGNERKELKVLGKVVLVSYVPK